MNCASPLRKPAYPSFSHSSSNPRSLKSCRLASYSSPLGTNGRSEVARNESTKVSSRNELNLEPRQLQAMSGRTLLCHGLNRLDGSSNTTSSRLRLLGLFDRFHMFALVSVAERLPTFQST